VIRTLLVTALLVLLPRAAFACPVCFGQNSTPMGNAVKAGVILMLVLVGVVLSGFAAFIVQLNRRARALAAGQSPADVGQGPAEAGHYAHNKGTV
jgi:hypothetical protein